MSWIKCASCDLVNPSTAVACSRCGRTFDEDDKIELEGSEAERSEPEASGEEDKRMIGKSQWTLIGVIIALTAAGLGYRLLVYNHLEQTSALFIGLPALLAIIVVVTPKAKSSTGMIMKGVTIALLMSGPLLGEGFICIIMAAPLFYIIGLIIGLIADHNRRKSEEEGFNKRTFGLLVLPFLLLSIEGVSDKVSFPRDETVTVERVVAARAEDVEQALAREPRFEKTLPLYLRMGFPKPVATSGAGLSTGDRRVIRFGGGEGNPGDLTLEVAEHAPGLVRFRALSDTSHVAHWLDWKEADVSWAKVDEGHTRVRWTLKYVRRLDPAWYFKPWERYAVGKAASYLIDTLATPAP